MSITPGPTYVWLLLHVRDPFLGGEVGRHQGMVYGHQTDLLASNEKLGLQNGNVPELDTVEDVEAVLLECFPA